MNLKTQRPNHKAHDYGAKFKILSSFEFAFFVLTFALCLPVSAWNDVGHRTVAELAWRQMSAAQRRAATELLEQHPHYKEMLTADLPKGISKDDWAFLSAAVWPDWVRDTWKGQPAKPPSASKYNL